MPSQGGGIKLKEGPLPGASLMPLNGNSWARTPRKLRGDEDPKLDTQI
jgi:hypothetical protein